MTEPTTHKGITNHQRSCLSHILRNASVSMLATAHFLEDLETQPDPGQVYEALAGIRDVLENMCQQLSKGSFCALHANECEFVSKFVGCDPQKRDSGD